MDPQALYVSLGELVRAMPNLSVGGAYPAETLKWLGQAEALVSELGNIGLSAHLHAVLNTGIVMADPMFRESFATQVALAVHRALALAELRAPAAVRGAFIMAGNVFDAMKALGQVLGTATRDVLIVDPYMDERTLTDYSPLAPQGVSIRLLADEHSRKPTLEPAAHRWIQQYGGARPLAVRLAPSRSLHDRAIFVDGQAAWVLTQSLNALAERAPATVSRVDTETAALKIPAYQGIWHGARVIY